MQLTSSQSDSSFEPQFDGQLFYGLEQEPGGTEIKTNLAEIREISKRLNAGVEVVDNADTISPSSMTINFEGEDLPIKRRDVHLGKFINDVVDDPVLETISVYELAKPQEMVESWMANDGETANDSDPFGVVMWPGSIIAAGELVKNREFISDAKTVLILGAGTGVEAQVAAKLGAKKVIATDNNGLTLTLLDHSVKAAGLVDTVQSAEFDIFSDRELPDADVVVAADVLYNPELAQQVGRRCQEVLCRSPRPMLIVTDSQRFHGTDFLESLNQEREAENLLEWEEVGLDRLTVAGILVEDDQEVNIKARLLSVKQSL